MRITGIDRIELELGLFHNRRSTGNMWERMRNYINRCGVNYLLTRQELLIELKGRFGKESTIDTYRNYLTQAGYLEKGYKVGIYKIRKEIPYGMSISDLKAEAYSPLGEPKLVWGTNTNEAKYFYTYSDNTSSNHIPKKKEFLTEEDFEL